MRYVIKDLTNIPPSLISDRALIEIEQIALGNKDIISDIIYKGNYVGADGKSQSVVRDTLNIYYKNKCAYCEQTCKAEIEHYRPKKGVTEVPAHGGYYWLCYSWSNLLPSCRYCNTEGGKGNKFPIINNANRVNKPDFIASRLDVSKCNASHSPLINEEPYLLHPEIDTNPENFLSFRISVDKVGIDIEGIDVKNRGNKTIEICNLNRADLRINRLESVYYHLKQQLNFVFELVAKGTLPAQNLNQALIIVFKKIEEQSNDISLTHTLLRKFVVKSVQNFEFFFSPYLESRELRAIAIQAFKNYKQAV